MMTKQMTKPSMDDLPRCSSTLPPAPRGENVGGGGDRVLGSIYFSVLKPHTNERNIVGQQLTLLLDITCWVRLRTLLHTVACYWELLRKV